MYKLDLIQIRYGVFDEVIILKTMKTDNSFLKCFCPVSLKTSLFSVNWHGLSNNTQKNTQILWNQYNAKYEAEVVNIFLQF